MTVIECGDKNLPRELDVQISVTRRTTETTTDLSVAVGVMTSGPLEHGAGRIQYYTSLDQVTDAGWSSSSEGFKCARDFFAQPGRATRMALAQIFDSAQAGFAKYGALGDLADFQAVSDGSFTIAIDGVSEEIDSLDFSSATSLDDVTDVVEAGLQAVATGGFTAATAINDGGRLKITSGTTGDSSSVSVMSAGTVGTNVAGTQYLNGSEATIVAGYTPGTISDELALVAEAARCSGRFVYAWVLDESLRDSPDQFEFAQFINARDQAIGGVTSNSVLALDPDSSSDIGVQVQAINNDGKLHVVYHDDPEYYPAMAVFAQMLGINFGAQNAVRTAKFLALNGIPPVGVSVTEWNVLESKGYNIHSATGNASLVYREGINGNQPIYYLDQRITLDNYAEDLSVALFNLIKTGKLGINALGQTQTQDVIDTVNERYVFNGAFSAKRVTDDNAQGFTDLPPYQTTLTPLELWPEAERAARRMTPARCLLNLTDFAHSIRADVVA